MRVWRAQPGDKALLLDQTGTASNMTNVARLTRLEAPAPTAARRLFTWIFSAYRRVRAVMNSVWMSPRLYAHV